MHVFNILPEDQNHTFVSRLSWNITTVVDITHSGTAMSA